MNEFDMDDLARILSEEEELKPMTGFSTRVMRAVKEEAVATEPMAFPWTRFLLGLCINLVLLLAATVWVLLDSGSSPQVQLIPTEWFSDPQAQGLLWAALTVVGTGVLAWTASQWAAPKRATSF